VKGFSRDDAERLLGFLERENELFEGIRDLTAEQSELLAVDDIDAYVASLDRRQEIIEEINGLHQESEVLMQSYISLMSEHDAESVASVDEALVRFGALVAECAAMDEVNGELAKEKAEEYMKRIGKLSLTRKGLSKYTQNLPGSSEHFDAKT